MCLIWVPNSCHVIATWYMLEITYLFVFIIFVSTA